MPWPMKPLSTIKQTMFRNNFNPVSNCMAVYILLEFCRDHRADLSVIGPLT